MVRVYSPYTDVLNATTPASSPVSRPNDPGYPDVLCEYDATQSLFVGQRVPVNQGFMNAWNFGTDGTNARRNITGEDNPGVTGSVTASTPTVSSGPQAPHGKSRVWRQRIPPRTGGDLTFQTNGGGTNLLDHDTNSSIPSNANYRAIYAHYWILYEGHDADGVRWMTSGRYRMIYNFNLCPNTHQGGIWAPFNQLPSTPLGSTDCQFNVGGGQQVTSFTPNMQMHCPNSTGNDGLSSTRRWTFSGLASQGQVARCGLFPGRWHRIEVIYIHSDADVENGAYRMFLDGSLVGAFENIVTRSNTSESGGCDPANGWYKGPSWRVGIHLFGGTMPQAEFANFADIYFAGIIV